MFNQLESVLVSTDKSATMTSKEIAELVESRHDKVKQSIERLAKSNVIQLPPMGEVQDLQSLSHNNKTKVYLFSGEQGKRDSIIVVAQLSPEFTARLVDRWQQLEMQVKFNLPQNYTQALEALLVQTKENTALQQKIEEDAPKVDYFNVVADSTYWMPISEVSSRLNFPTMGEINLFKFLRSEKVKVLKSYYSGHPEHNAPYQRYKEAGYFKQVPVTYEIQGQEFSKSRTVVSNLGVDFIIKKLREHGHITKVEQLTTQKSNKKLMPVEEFKEAA